FLLPSAQESFGLAALEAMACRVPVIASRVGGLPEVVEDGKQGFLLPVGDIEGMAEKAATLLADKGLHQKFGAAAQRRAVEYFSPDRVVGQYEACYRHLV